MTTEATTDPKATDPSPDPADAAPKASGNTRKPPGSTTKKAAGSTRKKAGSSTRRKSTPKGGRTSKADFRAMCAEMVDRLVGLVTMAGLASPRLAYDAQVLSANVDALTEELFTRGWDPKAGRMNRFGQWIERAGELGDWSRTFALIAGVGLPIAANHGLLPAEAVMLTNIARRPEDQVPMPPPRPKRTPDVADPDDGDQAEDDAAAGGRLGAWPVGDADVFADLGDVLRAEPEQGPPAP